MNHESTSLTLLDRLKAEDAIGWERLSNVYGPLVYQWARESGLQADDAADVVQEVFRGLLKSIHNFRKEKPSDTFRGWLYVVTRNKIRDFARKQSKLPAAQGGTEFNLRLNELPDSCAEESTAAGKSEVSGVYSRAIETIKDGFGEATWQSFWRMTVKNEPAKEIAEDLGLAVWTVYKHKARVMKKLRGEFGDLID